MFWLGVHHALVVNRSRHDDSIKRERECLGMLTDGEMTRPEDLGALGESYAQCLVESRISCFLIRNNEDYYPKGFVRTRIN
jgi:hypothetical protein